MKSGYVCITTNKPHGVLYVGATANIHQRLWQHKTAQGSVFRKQYVARRCAHIERFDDIRDALAREKNMKKWRREWKVKLIDKTNPEWRDLTEDL